MSTKNKKPIATSVLDDLIKDIESAWGIAMEKTTLKKNDGDQDDDDSDAPEAPAKDGASAPSDGQEGVAPAGQDQMAGGPADGQGAPAGAPTGPTDGQGAPGADQGAPGADGQDPGAGAPGADGQDPDQQLEQEGQQGQDGEISDEELQQIYGSMDPQELERHYMILRGILRDQYQKAEAGTEDKKDEDKSAKDMDKCGDMTTMSKSEKMIQDENKALKAKVEQLEKSTDGLLKAVKILTQPTRKAATTEIEFIKKSEETANEVTLSKAEIKDKLNQICKTNMTLTKNERDLANRYILTGSNELEVLKLIGAKS